jgi:hypothetical protein
MPRNFPAPLNTIIASGSASLGTLFEIGRRDGGVVRLTDSDQDAPVAGKLFVSAAGYERSAMSIREGFAVDELEIKGQFDPLGFTEADISDRLYAGASYKLWVFSPADISAGIGLLMSGKLGRVVPKPDGTFVAELRSKKDRFRQKITAEYQYECRAQLGDDRCKIPLAPFEVARSSTYFVNDFVRVPTHASAPARIAVPILNPSFNSVTGSKPDDWTETAGTVEAVTDDLLLLPAEGSRFVQGAAAVSQFAIDQTVSIQSLGISDATIDLGQVFASVHVRRGTGGEAQRGLGRFLVEALDGSANAIGVVYDSGFEHIAREGGWDRRGVTESPIPALTRSLRVECDGRRRSGTRPSTAFDNIAIAIYDVTATPLGQPLWENRIYECTTAGTTAGSAPTYDETVGNTTTDGSAVFTTREAWMREAVIASVTDQRIFGITVADPRAVDDWFSYGVAHWESGASVGLGMEVKNFTQTGGVVELFLPMRRTLAVGDKLRIFPGCPRYLTICKDKFDNVIDYRGFPHVPGNDFVAQYPDAVK